MRLKIFERSFLYTAVFLMLLVLIYQNIGLFEMGPILVPTPENKIVFPKSAVAIVRSSKANAEDIDYPEIKSMVTEAVTEVGGFDDIIHDGDVVVLKPNIMCLWIRKTARILPPEINGVTTDWRVTKAVVELIREINPNGKVYVMESSAFQETRLAMDSLKYTHENIPEVDEFVCLEESGKFEEWDSPKLVKVTLPEDVGLYPDNMNVNKSNVFYMNKIYYEADVVISMPVLKNHTHTGITGAIKNVGIGASPPNIYGAKEDIYATGSTPSAVAARLGKRIGLNRATKINHQPYYLDKWIHDYYMCRPVDFVITDGLQGIENGPDISSLTKAKNLEESQMNMRLIVAGKDAIAVDAIHSLLIGCDPYKIIHLLHLRDKSPGTINPALIRVNGKMVHEVKKDFAMTYERGAATKYYDFDPPALSVNSARIDGNTLHLALTVDSETAKVEVAVDEELLEQIVLHSFEDITMKLNNIKSGNHKITVYAFDRFLNCSTEEIVIK